MTLQLPTLDFEVETNASGQPKHQVLKGYFVQQIENGQLKPGTALPTELVMSSNFGVARTTVRRAMRTLEEDGLIRRVQGKGTFVHEDAAQRLQKGLAMFALIVPETRIALYPSLLHSFEEASREIQHQAIVCNTENNVDIQGNAILQLIHKQVAGVAIVPTTKPLTPAYQIQQLQQHQIPTVLLHRSVKGVQAPVLKLPHEKMAYLAGKTLTEKGHRRVAYIPSHNSEGNKWYISGLQAALRDAGTDLREEYIWCGASSVPNKLKDSIPAAVETMLSQPDRPTAIFASFDTVAELVYLELVRRGVRVPDDISLISIGGAWREGAIVSRLTSVTVDELATARRAVELLSEMRCGERPLTDEEQFELPILGLSNGQTLGPV